MGGSLDTEQTTNPTPEPTEEISEQYLSFQYPCLHLHLDDDWVHEKGIGGLVELWRWSTIKDDQMRTLHCVIDKWTLTIDNVLQEFHALVMNKKIHAAGSGALTNLNVYVHEFDQNIQYGTEQDHNSAAAWRWFIDTTTTTSLVIDCDQYHGDRAEKKWANAMINMFTYQTIKPARVRLTVRESTPPEEIKQLVISYITDLQSTPNPRVYLDIHHLVPNPLELTSDYETMHRSIQTFIAENEHASRRRGRFYAINVTPMKTITNDVKS